MKFEHLALNVEDPIEMALWYVKNLGMNIVREGGAPAHARFIADATGRVIMEIYNNPDAPEPDQPGTDPRTLHVAFAVEDIEGERRRLIEAGASAHDEITETPSGDLVVMLRDPWGLPLQLVQRAEPMV